MRSCRQISVAATMLLCLMAAAYGHAILVSATPAVREVVKGPNVTVKLRFNARVDAKRSNLRLFSSNGVERALSILETSRADYLNAEAKGLTGGSYVLRWQVLAGDGHISRCEVPFQVQ